MELLSQKELLLLYRFVSSTIAQFIGRTLKSLIRTGLKVIRKFRQCIHFLCLGSHQRRGPRDLSFPTCLLDLVLVTVSG